MIRAVRNFWVRTGALLSFVILALLLAFAGQASAAPLGQTSTGTITGRVLSLDNKALPNVHLAAYADAPGTTNRTKLGEFQSDAQGLYSVQVPVGTVWIEIETQDINGQSFWGYDNLPINVAAGQTVSGQDFRVAIRVVAEPPTAISEPTTAVPAPAIVPTAVPEPPGMPTTGSGSDLRLLLVGGLGLLLVLFGLVQRRCALR